MTTKSILGSVKRPLIVGLAFGMSGVTGLVAQTAPSEGEEDEVFVLSPFVVDSSSDRGYRANNTLAGSRMNTQLSDTAATISPFTKEFLNDLGADSMEDVLRYSSNVMRMDETAAEANGTQPLEQGFQFFFRGLPASRARNYFTWHVPSDNYNVSRVDESRGPNSILFGVGGAGGIVNATTKQAVFSDVNSVQLMIGSYSQYRAAVDFNRVLVDNKLAVRFNGLWDERETYRHFEYTDQVRYNLALTFKPFEKTTIRAELENGDIDQNRARNFVAANNGLAEWLAAGRPSQDEFTPELQASLDAIGADLYRPNTTFTVLGQNGTRYATLRGSPVTSRLPLAEGTTPFLDEVDGVISYDANPGGPDNTRDEDYKTYTVSFEQELTPKTFLELAFNHQETNFLQYDSDARSYRGLHYNWADGPDAGGVFIHSLWTRRWRHEEWDTFRATISHELSFRDVASGFWSKLLGRHRFAAMYEDEDSLIRRSTKRESWVVDGQESATVLSTDYLQVVNPTQINAANWVNRAKYITVGDFSTYQAESYKVPVTLQYGGKTYVNRFLEFRPTTVRPKDNGVESWMLSMQNYWWDSRLITSFGYRDDQLYSKEWTDAMIDPTSGEWVSDPNGAYTELTPDGITRTLGVVARPLPTRNVSFFYNKSNNLSLTTAGASISADGGPNPPQAGKGEDYGVMVDLFDSKLFLRATAFETATTNIADFGGISIPTNVMLDALLAAGHINQATYDEKFQSGNAWLKDSAADGLELELTANITDSWTARLSYSNTDRVASNIMRKVLAKYDELSDYWDTLPAGVFDTLVTAEGDTLAETWQDAYDQQIYPNIQYEGVADEGLVEEQWNLFSKYSFAEGMLNGLQLGAGVRYRGPSIVGVFSDDNGHFEKVYGNSNTLVDLMLAYRMKTDLFGNKVRTSYQLNVKNLFNERDPIIAQIYADGRVSKAVLQTPLTAQFRVNLDF